MALPPQHCLPTSMTKLEALLSKTTDPRDRGRIRSRIHWVKRRRQHSRNERDRAIREAHFAALLAEQAAYLTAEQEQDARLAH